MRHLSAIVLISTWLAACGGSSSGFTTGSTVSLDQLPTELGKALCQAEQACSPFFYQVAFGTADCASILSAQLQQDSFTQIQNAVSAKLANYDSSKAASCVSAVASGGCSVLDNNLPAVCREALSGTAAVGAACDIDAECSGRARCQITGNACPGVCAPLASAGVNCARNDDCSLGLICSAVTSRCVAPAALNEPCDGGSAEQCAAGLLCIGSSDDKGVAGTCQSQTQALSQHAGDSCSLDAGPWCAPGLSCVIVGTTPLSATCHALAAAAGPCGIGIPGECPAGQYCPLDLADLVKGTLSAACSALPGSGEPCGPAIGVTRCAGNLVCDASTAPLAPVCSERRALGESCTSNELCVSTHCVEHACVPASSCAR